MNGSIILKILAGLPGSGKTTLANKFHLQNVRYSKYWDFDKYYKEGKIDDFFIDLANSRNWCDIHIIDGLFLNNNDYENLLRQILSFDSLKNCLSKSKPCIEFHFFKPNIEFCLRNDMIRGRSESAEITIKNAKVEKPNIQYLTELFQKQMKLFQYEVETKTDLELDYEKFIKRHKLYDDRLYGENWSNGGNHCNCWGDNYKIDPDPEPEFNPKSFPEFIQLLNDICKGLPNEIISELFEKTVSIDYDRGESDYYGGHESKSAFYCDLKKLHKLLDEKSIITMGLLIKN